MGKTGRSRERACGLKKNAQCESSEFQCYSGTILNSLDQETASRFTLRNCSKEAREEPGYTYDFFAGKNM